MAYSTIGSKIKHLLRKAIKVMAVVIMIAGIGIGQSKAEIPELDREKLYHLPSSAEDVILSFIKMTGVDAPEMDKLVLKDEKYIKAKEFEKSTIMADEVFRLNQRYAELNPVNNGLLIRVPVNVNFENYPNKPASLAIEFPAAGLTYFPYYYGGVSVAVLVTGIENFQKIHLSEEERKSVIATINATPEATLILDLKPTKAAYDAPMILDGEMQLPLICEIGYIGIYNKDANPVWAWQQEWNKKNNSKNKLLHLAPITEPINNPSK